MIIKVIADWKFVEFAIRILSSDSSRNKRCFFENMIHLPWEHCQNIMFNKCTTDNSDIKCVDYIASICKTPVPSIELKYETIRQQNMVEYSKILVYSMSQPDRQLAWLGLKSSIEAGILLCRNGVLHDTLMCLPWESTRHSETTE